MSASTLAAAKLEAYVARVVAEAPPLSATQAHRIASLLGGGAHESGAVSPEVEARRAADEALSKAQARFRADLVGCHGCGLPLSAHRMQKEHGMGFHDYMPLTAGDTIKVATRHQPIIQAAMDAIDALGGAS